jgi:DeoR family transcriptional regulator of aga operon
MPDIPLNVFTTGPSIGIELCRLTNPVVALCGGTINRKNMALSGRNTLEVLEKINIDLAFIGVSRCSVETGFACGTESDMMVKRLVIEKARTSVMMCDKAKFGRLMPYTFADFSDVNYLISDDTIPENIRQMAEAAGVKIL